MGDIQYNPWIATDFNAFLWFVCPVCRYQTKASEDFEDHALLNHQSEYLTAQNCDAHRRTTVYFCEFCLQYNLVKNDCKNQPGCINSITLKPIELNEVENVKFQTRLKMLQKSSFASRVVSEISDLELSLWLKHQQWDQSNVQDKSYNDDDQVEGSDFAIKVQNQYEIEMKDDSLEPSNVQDSIEVFKQNTNENMTYQDKIQTLSLWLKHQQLKQSNVQDKIDNDGQVEESDCAFEVGNDDMLENQDEIDTKDELLEPCKEPSEVQDCIEVIKQNEDKNETDPLESTNENSEN